MKRFAPFIFATFLAMTCVAVAAPGFLEDDLRYWAVLGDITDNSGTAVIKNVSVYGYNSDIDATWTEMHDTGTVNIDLLPWSTAAETLTLSSSSTLDREGFEGAETVLVTGLDADWNEQSETVSLSGSTGVATTNTYIRLNSLTVATVGTYFQGEQVAAVTMTASANVGTILATGTTSGQVYGFIGTRTDGTTAAGTGVTQMARYTIPKGFTGILQGFSKEGDCKKYVNMEVVARQNSSDFSTNYPVKTIHMTGQGEASQASSQHRVKIPEMSDVWVRAYCSSSNCAASAQYSLLLFRDDYAVRSR